MEVISLEQAVEDGFKPLEYEIHRNFGSVRIRVFWGIWAIRYRPCFTVTFPMGSAFSRQ